jgi:hypothetical protein
MRWTILRKKRTIVKQINHILIKHVSEDSLRIVRILSSDILKLRFVRIVFIAALIFQMAMTLIQIYFFCCVLSLLDFVKYSTVFFGMFYGIHYPTSTRRHGNFAGVHTLLRILLSSNSAVLINIITGVLPPHFDFVVYYVLCQC